MLKRQKSRGSGQQRGVRIRLGFLAQPTGAGCALIVLSFEL